MPLVYTEFVVNQRDHVSNCSLFVAELRRDLRVILPFHQIGRDEAFPRAQQLQLLLNIRQCLLGVGVDGLGPTFPPSEVQSKIWTVARQ